MTQRQVYRRVRRGEAWLDGVLGCGWPLKVDLDKLDLGSSCNCVLGQLAADIIKSDRKRWWKRTKRWLQREGFSNARPQRFAEESNYHHAIGGFVGDGAPWPTLSEDEAERLGFYDPLAEIYPELTETWKRRITARQQELANA